MLSHNKQRWIQSRMPVWIAAASILQISETLIPHPIPGLRFGFANIISLVVLLQYGFKPALTITLLRTIVSSFILGSFLSPGFILSFTSGFLNICAIGLLHRFSSSHSVLRFSPIGLGIIGAFMHNLVQICLAFILLIQMPEIFYLVPWLSIGAVFMGGFSGWLTLQIIAEMNLNTVIRPIATENENGFKMEIYKARNSLIHKTKSEYKILILLLITLVLVLKQDLIVYTFFFVFVCLIVWISKLSFFKIFRIVKKIWAIALSTFVIPVLFNPGTVILIQAFGVALHKKAVILGSIFALRIVLLALFTSVLAQTTKIKDMISGMNRLIKPLNYLGMDTEKIVNLIFESIKRLPESWDEIRSVIRHLLKGKKKNLIEMKNVVVYVCVYILKARENEME